ncbi:helix-turn-helix domain-containing protein [Hamadaea sp.]|uniref:helix-turn-helix domain-containing protein n=1 Tax=Hamadaea sp. TaxID=2024425 RepID=UPI0025C187EB|nr:helix-turn-helix domain-containing protein [Hamadaea sp.]
MKRRALAERRKTMGFSQEDLAAELGVDRTTVIRWESGETEPQPWHRPRLAKALRLPVEDLADLLSGPGSAYAPAPPAGPALSWEDGPARELYRRGYGLLGHDDRQGIEAAAALLERAVDHDPTFAGAIAARGYTRWRKYFAGWPDSGEALQRALRDVEAALEADPGSVIAHVTFIRACWDMGWHEHALRAGRSVYLRHPDSLDASAAFARALTNAGLADVALPLVEAVLATDPTDLAAQKLRIWCLMLLGRHETAVRTAGAYLISHPTDANTRWAVALAAYHMEDRGLAARVAREAVTADPEDMTVWTLLGYLDPGTWGEALDRLSASEPNSRTAAWLANIHAAAGQVETARRLADELRAAHPANGYITYRLAHVYAQLGQSELALGCLRTAIELGFLSAQLLRREQDFGLASLRGLSGYETLLQQLDDNVERCRRLYVPWGAAR